MISAPMLRCMLVNPYGTPPGTTERWAEWVAQRSFGQEPGGTDGIIFGVACIVGSIRDDRQVYHLRTDNVLR